MSEWKPLALSAAVPTVVAASGVPAATWPDTAPPSAATSEAVPPRSDQTGETPTDDSGSPIGKKTPDSEARISSTSGEPSTTSTRRWPLPSNVRQFAAQARRVATMVLNDEIELDKARTYSAVARTVAQAMTTEMVRARFLRSEPDMGFEDAEDLGPPESGDRG